MKPTPMHMTDAEINALVDGDLPPGQLESYIDCTGKRCYRPFGEGARIRHENRVRRLREVQHQAELLRRERDEEARPRTRLIGLGHPEQPPESVPVWCDYDEADGRE